MKEPWSIKSRARKCAGSERVFEEGELIHAAIFPDPDSSGYLRKDFSDESWKKRDADSEAPFSHWKTIFKLPAAEEKTEDVVQDDPETLLRRLVEEEEEHTENARYILAVMLERKKILRETDTQQLPSGLLRVYEHRKSGDVFIIKDPEIALADIEKIQDEIQQLLDPQPEAQEEAEEEAAEPAQENQPPAEEPETPQEEAPTENPSTEQED